MEQLFENQDRSKSKRKGTLLKVLEFLEIKDKRESVLDNIRKSIGETEQILQKLSSFGSGMREEKQKIVNIFCVFVDKKTVDYSEKKKKFSKTDL